MVLAQICRHVLTYCEIIDKILPDGFHVAHDKSPHLP